MQQVVLYYIMKPTRLYTVLLIVISASSTNVKPNSLNDVWNTGLPAGNTIYRTLMTSLWKNCTAYKTHLGLDLNLTTKFHVSMLTLELWHKSELIGNEVPKEPYLIVKEVFGMLGAKERLLNSPHYKKDLPMTIFIHGFHSNSESDAPRNVASVLVSREDRNVLVLDSSRLISLAYIRSTHYSYYIGNELGKLLSSLHKDDTKLDVHLIGHSLGAQIAGFTGKTFKTMTSTNIARITALDPAGPCFSDLSPNLRLSNEDADFVDVIHTNAGAYGYIEPIGDADFYPNNGEEQPGCPLSSCSHERSWKLYVESVINPVAFPAVRCDSWKSFNVEKCRRNLIAHMGFSVENNAKGIYYLRTRSSSPYDLGLKGIESNHSIKNFLTNVFKTIHMKF